jgi:hypothetical protein
MSGISLISSSQGLTCDGRGKVIDYQPFQHALMGKIYNPGAFIKGNAFFNKDWDKGYIILENNDSISCNHIKYNIYIDNLILLRNNNYSQLIIDKATIKKFAFANGKSFTTFKKIKHKLLFETDSTTSYLQVLAEGKISLYALRRKNIVGIGSQAEFSDDDIYFTRTSNSTLQRFKKNRPALYKLIPEAKMEFKKILKEEHLRVRKEDDLIKAIEIFNNNQRNKTI